MAGFAMGPIVGPISKSTTSVRLKIKSNNHKLDR